MFKLKILYTDRQANRGWHQIGLLHTKPIKMNNHTNRKTFIVDDDPFWAAILTQILIGLGYIDIISYSNGADCISNLHQKPELIFLDYNMGAMDGLEVLQKIKAYNSDIVVIFCTDQKEISVAVSAMKNGSFDYLVKSDCIGNDLPLTIQKMTEMRVFAEKIF